MFKAKDLEIKLIKSCDANQIIKRLHYSGKVCQNSQIHFGVFGKGCLLGAIQYGPSTDKRKMAKSLSVGVNEFLELNRVAISDVCGKNSESRCLGITLKKLKKRYSFLRLVLSFADACQCGDGAIYRAANFKLLSFKKNRSLIRLTEEARKEIQKYQPNCNDIVVSDKTLNNQKGVRLLKIAKELGAEPLAGFQMKYAYFFDKSLEAQAENIPFSAIPEGVKMYRGKKSCDASVV